ncbi:TRM11 family SAM-dependent methyltransferase [Paenibacillus xanthanilyticus]|uniref:TRM11 family SAM-dependent methyltransferase n=1 Tax=Paenibacillus xanthanilyticus TaxID=1783531 RepID=A0ABV8JUU6_9BACL
MNEAGLAPLYLYPVACHEDETELCAMEMRALFGQDPEEGCVRAAVLLPPSRSPFIRGRLRVMLEAAGLDDLAASAARLDVGDGSYKVVFVETDGAVAYEDRLAAARRIGGAIRGRADMKRPDRLIGLAYAGGRWLLGDYEQAEAAWLTHNKKPHPYSTALSTRVARAVANIAVPRVEGARAIDPCCGIGTVVIEALSMGIDIVGRDINPLAVRGARANLAHYGMPDVVKRGDLLEMEGEGTYDAAIVDLPYNLCSVLSPETRIAMLRAAGRLAPRVAIVTTETIDEELPLAGLTVLDRCVVRKGRFERHVLLCSSD